MLRLAKNIRGVSLTEVVLSTALGSIVLYGLHLGVQQFRSLGTKYTTIGDRAERLQEAYTTLMKIGRLAGGPVGQSSCTRVSAGFLRCQVDFNMPPTGVMSTVEFQLVGRDLIYRTNQGGAMTTHATYTNITTFEICDDAMMIAGTCTIQPRDISTQHAANLAAAPGTKTLDGHFFRFNLVWNPATAQQDRIGASALQGAFYSRNPTSVMGLAYQAFQRGS